MSFSGINQFGSLTLQNGQRLSFNDIKDIDGDGKISKDEFNAFLKENNVDTIELSLVDKNGDGEITEQEFAVLEQKQQMQEAVNAIAQDISIDFAGTTLIPEITAKLKDLIADYENNYNGDVSKMAEAFKQELPANYERIKNEVLANDPNTIRTNTVNDIIADLASTKSSDGSPALTVAAKNTLAKQLDNVAAAYMKANPNATPAELTEYLNEWLTKTDAEKMADDVSKYQERVARYGETIESSELAGLKECAKYLVQAALDNGVAAKLGEQTVTATNVNAVLNKYTDGAALKADIQAFIDGLSTVNKKDQIIADEAAKAEAAAEKAFTDIPGSAYAVNPSLIDYSNIPGYANNEKYSVKGRKNSGAVKDQVRQQLESLKSQIKAQIEKMLESKGVPADKVAQIFDNVFQDTLTSFINGLGTTSKRTGFLGLGKGKCTAADGIQTIVQNFITAFNTNIAARIDEMNKTNTDMDLVDIDYTAMAKDDEGNADPGVLNALQNGGAVVGFHNRSENYNVTEEAKEMINKLKPQMLQKAMNMCRANGIEFDNTVFTTMFNNAQSSAIAAGSKEINLGFVKCANINPQSIATTFTTEFKTNYTTWVETAKAKLGN